MRRDGVWNCPTESHYDIRHYDIVLRTHPNILKVLQDSGVKLLLGTDEVPWQGLITRELQSFVNDGLTPYQALLTTTRNPAEYFGISQEIGTIAVGKQANLVLLTGNPLQDVRYTAQPAGVMLGGRWLPRAEIDRRLTTFTLPAANFNGDVSIGPIEGYWHNVLHEKLETILPVLSGIAVPDSQQARSKALQAAHKTQQLALVDSLGTSDQYKEGTQRILNLVAQQLGDDRTVIAPNQLTLFDTRVNLWIKQRAAYGETVTVPGMQAPQPDTGNRFMN
jgi:hypothetical protein